MKKILLTISCALLIGGCSSKNSQIESEKNKVAYLQEQITNLETQKNKDVFEKKQECLKYYDRINKESAEGEGTHRTTNGGYSEITISVESIFYSSKRNSCLSYIVRRANYNGIYTEYSMIHRVKDILTNEPLEMIVEELKGDELAFYDHFHYKTYNSRDEISSLIEDYKK